MVKRLSKRATATPTWASGCAALRRLPFDAVVTTDELVTFLGCSRATYYRLLFPALRDFRLRHTNIYYAGDVVRALREGGLDAGVR